MTTVLIVDDDPVNRSLLASLVGYRGMNVIEATDGEQALELVRVYAPDLVVTDVLMPKVDGYEFVRRMRLAPEMARIAVIFLSGTYVDKASRELASTLGVAAMLSKPADPEVVLEAIDATLGCVTPVRGTAVGSATVQEEHTRLLTDRLVSKVGELERYVADLRWAHAALSYSESMLATRARQQASVSRLGQEALGGADTSELMDRAAVAAAEGLEVAICGVVEVCAESQDGTLRAGIGWPKGAVGVIRVPSGPGTMAGHALSSTGVLAVSDIREETRFIAPAWLRSTGFVSALCVRIDGRERPYGLLCAHGAGARTFTDDDVNFLQSVANVLGAAIARRRSEEEVLRSREEMRALADHSERVREAERRRISREIHDELGQALTALKMDARAIAKAAGADNVPVADRATSMMQLLDKTAQTVRKIATELRPGVLDDLGLVPALEWLARETESRSGIRCRFESEVEEPILDGERATVIFRIVQEALTNVMRHSGAFSVAIAVGIEEADFVVSVTDDGRGIGPDVLANTPSLGLLGMRERARLAGGRVAVSTAPGSGCRVTLRVPVGGAKERHA